jgi:hypothetical protein
MGPNQDLSPYSEEQLYGLYEKILPKGSLGRLADNPLRFMDYFLDKDIAHHVIPNLVLARDLDTNGMTWHYFCDRADTLDLVGSSRWLYENIASGHRDRNLEISELYSYFDKKYIIIKKDKIISFPCRFL